MQSRRAILQGLAAAGGLGLLSPTAALAKQSLSFARMGFTLAIHIPSVAAIREILPSLYGYGPSDVTGIDHIQTITETMVSGSMDFGDADFLSTVKAVQSGGDLVILGNVYCNTDLVLTVNTKKITDIKDLFKPGVVVAVNGPVDGTFVSWAGALLQEHLDPAKLNTVEVGGSGARMLALRSGRVDATAIHVDQAKALEKLGGFKVLIEPWKVFHPWMNEVWVTQPHRLEKPEYQKAAVNLLKATLIAFRKANSDFDWYAKRYRRYATIHGARTASDETIRSVWETLRGPVGAWPSDMNFSVANAQRLLPALQGTGAVKGNIDFAKFMLPQYLHQALTQLSA